MAVILAVTAAAATAAAVGMDVGQGGACAASGGVTACKKKKNHVQSNGTRLADYLWNIQNHIAKNHIRAQSLRHLWPNTHIFVCG